MPSLRNLETVLVLSGGNALGSYEAGAYEALCRRGLHPTWIAGASIGAVNGALIAGNDPDRRLDQLRSFWTIAAQPEAMGARGIGTEWRRAHNLFSVLQARLLGRPGLFTPRPSGLIGGLPGLLNDVALYDTGPLADTLRALIDFDRIATADVRLTIGTTDVENGQEVFFDSRRDRITPDHLLATVALLPDFPPVEIDGRTLSDGGLSINAPVDPVFAEPPDRPWLCVVVDLFDCWGGRPASLDDAIQRRNDLTFSNPVRRSLAAQRIQHRLRRAIGDIARRLPDAERERRGVRSAVAEGQAADVTVIHLHYYPAPHELALKTSDYSGASLLDRWDAGRRDMEDCLRAVERRPPEPDGMTLFEARRVRHAEGDGADRLAISRVA